MRKPLYILNGPNLNLLGERQPEIYGTTTLKDVEKSCAAKADTLGLKTVFMQTNIEGELVNMLQEARVKASAVIINPAAYTHTSVALYDTIKALDIPVIEVHISQPAARESFRRRSYVAEAATGSISGLGIEGYLLAIDAAALLIDKGLN